MVKPAWNSVPFAKKFERSLSDALVYTRRTFLKGLRMRRYSNHHVCCPGGRHVWWDAQLKIVYFKHSWPGGHWWGGLVWLFVVFHDEKTNQPFWTKSDTWLILPVVICLSQRLSHACLSISVILWNCEWLIKSAIVYLVVFTTRITVVILELIRAPTWHSVSGYLLDQTPIASASGES